MAHTILHSFTRRGLGFAATAALLLLPSFGQAGVIFRSGAAAQPDMKYGQIHFHPKSITLDVNAPVGGSAHFRVKQRGNTKNHYKAQIACNLNLGSPPTVHMDGRVGTISVPAQGVGGLSLLCNVTVLGEGGVTGTLPVTISINA